MVQAQPDKAAVIEYYGRDFAARSGVAFGGLGTGTFELRKDGVFHNWTIANNKPLGVGPYLRATKENPRYEWENSILFFYVRYQPEGEDARIELLQGTANRLEGRTSNGMYRISYIYPWMSTIQNIDYQARFPTVKMKFSDEDMPLDIEMEVISSFIPHDVKNSALPGAQFNFNITSTSGKPIDVMIIGSERNLAGYNTLDKYWESEAIVGENHVIAHQKINGSDTTASDYGDMSIAYIGDNPSYYLGWMHRHPYYELLLENKTLGNRDATERQNLALIQISEPTSPY